MCVILSGCTKAQNPKSEDFNSGDEWLYETVQAPASVESEDVYTFMCELITQRPKEILNTCADGGIGVWDIAWSSWDRTGANGTGTLRINDCEPNCAEGSFSSEPIRIELKGFNFDGSRYIFNTAKIRLIKMKYAKDEYELVWDLADFYREVPGMRN
jgi:hypothetical protein